MTQFRFLVLSDIHGNNKAVTKLVKHVLKNKITINMILISGDLPITTPNRLMLDYIRRNRNLSKIGYTKWVYKGKGREEFIRHQITSVTKIFTQLTKLDSPIIYIPGNVDSYEVQKFINDFNTENITLIDGTSKKILGLNFIGVGGTIMAKNPFNIPLCDMEYNENQFSSKIRTTELIEGNEPTILISHEAPKFIFTTQHKKDFIGGSGALTRFIEEVKPNIVIFGHFHEFSLKLKHEEKIYLNPGPLAC